MSELPTPRYHIGQIVYLPSTDRTATKLPCPDCLGERVWQITTPAGTAHTCECPRCTDRYAHSGALDKLPSLYIERLVPVVRRLTIGSITAKTHPWHNDDPVEYMANETGIGSGSTYREGRLFADEVSALAVAEAEAAIANSKIDERREVIASRKFSGLSLTDAALDRLKEGVFDAWAAFRSLVYGIENHLPEDSSQDNELEAEIRETIDQSGRYAGSYSRHDRHPIDAIIAAETDEARGAAIDALKKMAGLDMRPEPPPCTCEHATKYLYSRDCPRHGGRPGEVML